MGPGGEGDGSVFARLETPLLMLILGREFLSLALSPRQAIKIIAMMTGLWGCLFPKRRTLLGYGLGKGVPFRNLKFFFVFFFLPSKERAKINACGIYKWSIS